MILSGSDAPWSCRLAPRLFVTEYVLYPVFHFVVATGVFLYSCRAVCFLPNPRPPSRLDSSRSLVFGVCLVFGSDVSPPVSRLLFRNNNVVRRTLAIPSVPFVGYSGIGPFATITRPTDPMEKKKHDV